MASNYDAIIYTSKHFRSQLKEHMASYREEATASSRDSGYGGSPAQTIKIPIGTCKCHPVHQRPADPQKKTCRFVPSPPLTSLNGVDIGYAILTEHEAFARWYDAGHRGPVLPYNKGARCPSHLLHRSVNPIAQETGRWHKYRRERGRQARIERERVQDEEDEAWLLEHREKRLSGELDREYRALGNWRDQWVLDHAGGMEQDVRDEELTQLVRITHETAWEPAASPCPWAVQQRLLAAAPRQHSLRLIADARAGWWQWAEDQGMIHRGGVRGLWGDRVAWTPLWEWLGIDMRAEGTPEYRFGESREVVARVAREGWVGFEILGLEGVVLEKRVVEL